MKPIPPELKNPQAWRRNPQWWSGVVKPNEADAVTRWRIQNYECRNITYMADDGSWPIIWKRASGVSVWDERGKKYLDLTAAFGVAATGHGNPGVIRASQKQMWQLLHAMGDVHPHALKARLAEVLSNITFETWMYEYHKCKGTPFSEKWYQHGKTIFCNSGFEAVEAALKTANLATGKSGIIAFDGAYHGLGYGALNVTHRSYFRSRFVSQLKQFGQFVLFPTTPEELRRSLREIRRLLRGSRIGAILVEPIQARGGIRIPAGGFLKSLREICDEFGAVLIYDEIFTGFGRTGFLFACEESVAPPDIVCLGKALTGGFPLSACVGRAEVMDAWPQTEGEAIHTSTYLGHPVGCAMALAQIEIIQSRELAQRSCQLGHFLLRTLKRIKAPPLQIEARGKGLMAGLELRTGSGAPATAVVSQVIKKMLHKGFILLPEGEHANVIALTPPLTITKRNLRRAVANLKRVILECASSA